MAFFFRILGIVALMLILSGLMIKMNGWNYSLSLVCVNSGLILMAISVLRAFVVNELKRRKEGENNK